jgi:xanthine dehydrogenase YagT iron-sulfur-binding subunit
MLAYNTIPLTIESPKVGTIFSVYITQFNPMNEVIEKQKNKAATVDGDQQPVTVSFEINGKHYELQLEAWTSLLDMLREYLNLTGTKKGCDHGQCGACTILVNGTRINSCLTFAAMHNGATITTIEGLAQGEKLHPLQQAFIDHDAFQCGYCTPGQICSAIGMINEGHVKSKDDVYELMSGNICRCAAYNNIYDAIETVMQGKEKTQEA